MSTIIVDNKSYLIGSKIKKAREEAGLTQGALGELIGGYSAMAISYFEKGEREIKTDLLSKIADSLSKSIEYFFETTSHDKSNAVSAYFRRGQYDLSPEERKKEEVAVKDFKEYIKKQFSEKK